MMPLRRRVLLSITQICDVGLIACAFALATIVAQSQTGGITWADYLSTKVKIREFVLFAGFLAGGHISFSFFGLYRSRRLSSRISEIFDILKATALGTALLGFSTPLYFPETYYIFLVVFFSSVSLFMIGSRLLIRWLLAQIRARGLNLRFVLIVGTNPRAVHFAKRIEQRADLGYRVIGFVDNEWQGTKEFLQNGHRLVSNLEGFAEYVRHHIVDEVFVELPVKSQYQIASRILAVCEEQGIIVRYLPEIFGSKRFKVETEEIGGGSLVTLYPVPVDSWQLIIKRLLDISLSLVSLVLLFPLLVAVGLLIKLTSPGPALFVQKRVGVNKRQFPLYKFRTMVCSAEKMQQRLESLNEMTGPVFKIRNDPRITRIGRFLRKTSIDELPQLFNVLKGDMSLVGPRPLPLRDYAGFGEDWQRRRFSIRPGITCLWQINGRNNVSFDHWMAMDMQYIDQWSLLLDFSILIKTIPALFRCTGAC